MSSMQFCRAARSEIDSPIGSEADQKGREAPCCLRFTLTYFKGPIYNGQKQQEHRTIIVGMGKKNMEDNRAAYVSRE